MELRFRGQFNRDIAGQNRILSEAISDTIVNVKNAPSPAQINNFKKLRKYRTHYRIKVLGDYRMGVIIKGKTVWFVRFGHRNIFYKKLFP
jgi:mRNA-degrading endonuclease RelE of RelBE toxin-antitoxin system